MAQDVSTPGVLLKGLAPFILATLLGFALVVFTTSLAVPQFLSALALTGTVIAATVWLPWRRLPAMARVTPSLLFLISVALLRDAAGGTASGVAGLVLLPAFWISLHGTRRELAVVVAGIAAFFLAPIVAVGGAAYPASGYRTAVILVAVSAIIGHTVQRLVRQVRRHADDLQRVAAISRRIALSGDARSEVCEAARELSGATFAFLLEPRDGSLLSTAMVGLDAPPVTSGPSSRPTPAMRAFTSGEALFIADARKWDEKDEELWRSHGSPASMLFKPIIGDASEPLGVLVLGWAQAVDRHLRVVTLLAGEAAHAIEQADLVHELSGLASSDALTGLHNRRAWDEQLGHTLSSGANEPICVALIDLDNFKAFNDGHGHQAGDRLLKEAASRWRAALRPGDLLARYGGEEFAVLLPACTLDRAELVLERLREATPGRETCSAGIARWDGRESGEALLGRADRALYAAKAAGRDCALVA
jgi:diguanylate cyclase (GGDEF)-like protein